MAETYASAVAADERDELATENAHLRRDLLEDWLCQHSVCCSGRLTDERCALGPACQCPLPRWLFAEEWRPSLPTRPCPTDEWSAQQIRELLVAAVHMQRDTARGVGVAT